MVEGDGLEGVGFLKYFEFSVGFGIIFFGVFFGRSELVFYGFCGFLDELKWRLLLYVEGKGKDLGVWGFRS